MKENPYSTVGIRQEESSSTNAGNPDALSLSDQETLRFGQDTEYRRWLVKWMMWVVNLWLFGVFIVTALSEALLHIDATVLCVLLATTTFNVLGLSKIILNGLFGQGGKEFRGYHVKK